LPVVGLGGGRAYFGLARELAGRTLGEGIDRPDLAGLATVRAAIERRPVVRFDALGAVPNVLRRWFVVVAL
jgi:hypothetical protein